MMNKSKTSKAWRWKVATFLPLLALLLMAFGNRSEKVPPEQDLLGSGIFAYQSDLLKQWTEADFMPISKKEIEKQFFQGKKIVNVLLNSKSELMIDKVRCQMSDVPNLIRKFRDSGFAEYKSDYSKVMINGKEKLTPEIPFVVMKDDGAKADIYQNLLNAIGNTILEIRGRYAIDIFGIAYSSLTQTQKNEIDHLIPFAIHFQTPKTLQESANSQSTLVIQIKQDGNYINNKLCTLEGITEKLEALSISKQDEVYYVVDVRIPQNRIDEVKTVVNQVTDNFKRLLPPPPPPPTVKDMSILIHIKEDAFSVNQKVCTFDEIKKMLDDIDPKKEFAEIETRSTSNKELQLSLKEMLEKKGITYRISWTK